MEQRKVQTWVMGFVLGGLCLASFFLAANRIYQVDEAQNLFMVRVLGTHQTCVYFSNALLWMLGPFSWYAASATESAKLFFTARMVFCCVFVINVLLLALNTGVRLRSQKGLWTLLVAATLAPLWDYGFEIRHDNLILLGLLAIWYLGRVRPRGLRSYAGLGWLTVVLLFVAFKSFAYVLPLSVAFLLLPPPGHGEGRLRLWLAWSGGAVLACLMVFVAYWVSGQWGNFLAGLRGGFQTQAIGSRFGPWLALGRLPGQTPLLLGLALAGALEVGLALWARRREAFSWAGQLPEFLLCLGALGVLLVNPTPFPYNLVNFVPFLFLLGFRFVSERLDLGSMSSQGRVAALGILCFCHAAPFAIATFRHFDKDNGRQETLMSMAEALTDPKTDRVYDAIGMVPTRGSIGFNWYLHSLNIQGFQCGRFPTVSQMLEARPAAVIIPSYRTDWLPETDRRFIQQRYYPLADDFWVLGCVLPVGGGTYEVVHAGRYLMLGVRQGRLEQPSLMTVDGRPLAAEPVRLFEGAHRVDCPADVQPVVLWIGPSLNQLPRIGAGHHNNLFVNWY